MHTRSCIWFTHTHTLNINQPKSLSTTLWCHCASIIHPWGRGGQHRSVSHWQPRARRSQPQARLPAPGSRANHEPSWIMHRPTQVLVWKWIPDQYWTFCVKKNKERKKERKKEEHSPWIEVLGIIIQQWVSERTGGATWASNLNAPLNHTESKWWVNTRPCSGDQGWGGGDYVYLRDRRVFHVEWVGVIFSCWVTSWLWLLLSFVFEALFMTLKQTL